MNKKVDNNKLLIDSIKESIAKLDRNSDYKKNLLNTLIEVIQHQRNFDMKSSGSVIPRITDCIDANAQIISEE